MGDAGFEKLRGRLNQWWEEDDDGGSDGNESREGDEQSERIDLNIGL